jgi:hypothetical protein
MIVEPAHSGFDEVRPNVHIPANASSLSRAKTVVAHWLHADLHATRASKVIQWFLLILIAVNVVMVVLESVEPLARRHARLRTSNWFRSSSSRSSTCFACGSRRYTRVSHTRSGAAFVSRFRQWR